MRFRCVDTSGGALQFSPKRTCNIIVATAVLHNICIDNKVPDPVGRAVINDGNDNVYRGTLNDGTENMDSEDKKAFEVNARVFSGGLSKEQVIDYYNKWDDYEAHLQPGRYNGPAYAAEAVDRSFPSNKDTIEILDVAAGTGLVGEELVKKGFKRFHALDPSENMLRKARMKNIYEKFFCEFLSVEPSPNISNGTYPCVVCSGGFGSGHIPSDGLLEMIRITKPGGMIIIVMREEYLNIPEYCNSLEPLMKKYEKEGLWVCVEKSIVHKYFCDKTGIIFRFQVNQNSQ
ncbi:methyltransferase-like protein 27 [Saccostrea echinata]|uniref:methyltransferase-like protein 27 n=1 Tax=Saccostrea echinata TaxID=191078 RepID=UPI002A841C85|nr:methyltransferase-like protein 27 [Saccostrea echinata]